MQKFVQVHVHSTGSTQDGLAQISDMVRLAKERNELFILTDHGSIQNWMAYYVEAKNAGIKGIFGIETYINPYRDELFDVLDKIKKLPKSKSDPQLNNKRDELSKKRMHLNLIAKNKVGFYNIIQIANDAYTNGFYSKQLTNYDIILNNKEGIIVTSACMAGPLSEYLSTNDFDEAVNFIKMMKENFGDDFYLEVQINEMPQQKKYNEFVLKLAKKTKTKLLCGIDSHYIDKNDAIVHQDLLLIQNKSKAKDIGKKDIRVTFENKKGEKKVKKINPDKTTEFKKGIEYSTLKIGEIVGKDKDKILDIEEVNRVWEFEATNLYFKSKEDLIKEIKSSELKSYEEEIIKNHYELDKKIEHFEIDTDSKLPHIDNANKIITELCTKALRKLNKNKKLLVAPKRYIDRLKFEMEVIEHNGFETYFLILYDIIQYCKKHDIALGAGRGSAVSSLVSYLLEITRIDPLDPRWSEEGLPFERFLDTSRNAALIYVDNGTEELKFYEFDDVNVIRDKKEIVIKAFEIQENDEIVMEQ